MKHARIFLLWVTLVAMACCNFLNGKNLTDITLTTNEISEDSLLQMSKESYMVPYVKYLMKADIPWEWGDRWFYTLVYIDDDKIPEMIVRSDMYNALDGLVMSQHDGIVSSIEVSHEVEYNEREGRLIIITGGQVESISRVFQLKNGKFELAATEMELEGEEITYYFNDAKVDQETAERLLGEVFEYKETTISIEDLEWMSWVDLLKNKESIKGWK